MNINDRLFPQAGTPTQTPTPKKGVGFQFDGTPSTDNDSTGGYSPPPIEQHTPSPAELPRAMMSPASDSEETSMDIADDNLTLPLPSALIKRQLQRGVGFLVDDGDTDDDEEMDVTQSLGGIIIPPRDGVNRFLNGDDDQTMEFTQIYPSQVQRRRKMILLEWNLRKLLERFRVSFSLALIPLVLTRRIVHLSMTMMVFSTIFES